MQHGLHAYTPSDQKAVKAAAMSFRANPAFDTEETLTSLGTGKAVVSFLGEDGVPGMAQKVSVLPPQCSMGSIGDGQREQSVKSSLFYSKYAEGYDPESAYEILMRLGQEEQAREEQAAAEAAQVKEDARLSKEQAKADEKAAREAEKESAAKNRAIKSVGNSVLGTIGRAAGRSIGGSVGGSLGRSVGGNLGASLVRGLLGTFFKR
ncbi:MAG: helicase HerA-like domain-containing protein [Dialister invisus]